MQRDRVHTLVVTEGPMVGERYTLYNLISTLGRASSNTIVLESAQISRLHAQIRLQPQGVMIEDMGSVNGTFVNGRRIDAPQLLSPGDLIRFAEFATLQYAVQERSEPERPGIAGPQGSTRVMGERLGTAQPSPISSAYEGPVAPRPSVAYEPAMPARAREERAAQRSVAPARPPTSADPKRPTWLYGVIVILLVLLCLGGALAVFLWFAPADFWEQLFQLVGVPLPTGALLIAG
jgi:hypothetical protein